MNLGPLQEQVPLTTTQSLQDQQWVCTFQPTQTSPVLRLEYARPAPDCRLRPRSHDTWHEGCESDRTKPWDSHVALRLASSLHFCPHLEMGQERAHFVLSNRISSGSLSMWRRGEVWSWGSNSRLHTCQVRAPTLTHTQINNFKVASGTFTTLYNHSCYLGSKHFVSQKEALPSSSPYSSFALLPDRSDRNLPSHHRLSGRVSMDPKSLLFLAGGLGRAFLCTQGTRRWYGG